MLFELRQYRIRPGMRDAWVKRMEEIIIPFQIAKGVVVVGSFTALDEDDLYIWIRRFDSEAERERLYKDIYESDEWKNVIGPANAPMLIREKFVITRMAPTPHSVLR